MTITEVKTSGTIFINLNSLMQHFVSSAGIILTREILHIVSEALKISPSTLSFQFQFARMFNLLVSPLLSP